MALHGRLFSRRRGAKVLEKRGIIRTLGVEGVRGLARVRLANLSHVCSNYRHRQSGPNRGREKAYYENARQAHYERFGPRAVLQIGPPTTLLLASKGQEQVAGFPHRYRKLGEVS